MARRYYVSDIVGTGTDEDPYEPRAVRVARLAGIPIRAVHEIATDPVTGHPTRNWAFSRLAAQAHATLIAAAGVDALPDLTLDALLSSLTNAQLTVIRNRLEARGIDTSQLTGQRAFRFLVRLLGRLQNAAFEEDNFDTSDF